MVMFALLGGMILNLMPCVFPVLSLKVLGIAQKGGGAHDRIEHGLAYTAGVVISFLAVAAVLIALRQAGEAIGWGFHLQSPVFVGGLAYLCTPAADDLIGTDVSMRDDVFRKRIGLGN
jgi:thiol:disulfide interchange protein DsbD